MTKKELKQIVNMFHNGVSSELCIAIIIERMALKPSSITSNMIWAFVTEAFLVTRKLK